MKLIVLDIDGVICSDGSQIESESVDALWWICHLSHAVVAISSSRRTKEPGIGWIADTLEDRGITVVAQTVDLPYSSNMHSDRVDEIVDLVRRMGPDNWLAIDDLPLPLLTIPDRAGISCEQMRLHHLQTEFLTGLQHHHIHDAVHILSRRPAYP